MQTFNLAEMQNEINEINEKIKRATALGKKSCEIQISNSQVVEILKNNYSRLCPLPPNTLIHFKKKINANFLTSWCLCLPKITEFITVEFAI